MWIASVLDALGFNAASTSQTAPPPEVLLVVNKPGATIVFTRRKTNISKKVYIEVWASADETLILNGQQVTT